MRSEIGGSCKASVAGLSKGRLLTLLIFVELRKKCSFEREDEDDGCWTIHFWLVNLGCLYLFGLTFGLAWLLLKGLLFSVIFCSSVLEPVDTLDLVHVQVQPYQKWTFLGPIWTILAISFFSSWLGLGFFR